GASLGIRYDFGKTTLDLELAYRRPFTAATNVGSATANTQLWGGYYDTVDDTQMNHFWLTLRVLSPFGLGGGGSGGKTKGTVPCPSFH
ncbi:MAG: hypothetical protein RIS47_2001, partial [Bacteroidota bacterium]